MPMQPAATTGEAPRQASNLRVALILGGLALVLFLVTLWQFRPM